MIVAYILQYTLITVTEKYQTNCPKTFHHYSHVNYGTWSLHLHQCVRFPSLALKFPGPNPFSRAWKFYTQKIQDFPGLSNRRGNPAKLLPRQVVAKMYTLLTKN